MDTETARNPDVDAAQIEAPVVAQPEEKYWQKKAGVAPVKSEYVLWDKIKSGAGPREVDDDAAEGRTKEVQAEERRRPLSRNEEDELRKQGIEVPRSDEPQQKKVRLSGAQKKAAAKERKEAEWQAKKAEQAARKAAEKEGKTVVEGAGGAQEEKQKGQNKNRRFNHKAGVTIQLCTATSLGKPCTRTNGCKYSHDLPAFLVAREADIPISIPGEEDRVRICPMWEKTGSCPSGFKCRFLDTHLKAVGEGNGVDGCGWELVVDEEKFAKWEAERIANGWSEKGEKNLIQQDVIKTIRGGNDRETRYPLSTAYLYSIGEPLDAREAANNNRNAAKKRDRAPDSPKVIEPVVYEAVDDDEIVPEVEQTPVEAEQPVDPAPAAESQLATVEADSVEPASVQPPVASTSETTPVTTATDADSRPEVDLARVRLSEKKRLDFRGKLYMAPLTTVGNLPFRRLAGDFGNDISCGEMGLAQEFLNGNGNEWSLVRRHPSEKMFGIQICGSRPQALVPAAEAIVKHCEIDFLDVNCGCPIDLVFNKGGGSALLGHAAKLGRSLVGMSQVLGEIPLTVKIRTGIQHTKPVAHLLAPKFQREWGVSALTLHGRSRQQRYSKAANFEYIGEVAKVVRETAADLDLPPIPFFGNGDAYDYRSYYENMEASGVDGIMIARGALVKPWIFTEIKERRDWDISARERLDMVGKLASYGLEHWGSDTQGLNTTRRFLLEALSFQCRYVPVGLLERFPSQLNERAYPYKGRDELETLLASDQATDWIKISSMFLGPPPEGWEFKPKHKSNANAGDADAQG